MKAQLEEADLEIQKYSRTAKKAPSEFVENELRRWLNRYALVFGRNEFNHLTVKDFADITKMLEADYQCYFETEQFARTLRASSWWKFTYAGCNAQIEDFLRANEFETMLEILESGGLRKGAKRLRDEEFFMPLPNSPLDKLRRYFIGIGYLFPVKPGVVKIHPNFFLGQLGMNTAYHTADSPFLTRDLIRCPYHETQYRMRKDSLSDQELWYYWKDLLALSLGNLPEYIHYSCGHLRGQEKLTPELQTCLELGRRFVPQRYVELEPRIEKFEWYFPSG